MSCDETNQVGKITKQWMGLMELFTDADNFSVSCKLAIFYNIHAKCETVNESIILQFSYLIISSKI